MGLVVLGIVAAASVVGALAIKKPGDSAPVTNAEPNVTAAAPDPAGAPPAPAGPRPACLGKAECPEGSECVAPGMCSRLCKSDRDCSGGRTCAELRVMGSDGTTAHTCVAAARP